MNLIVESLLSTLSLSLSSISIRSLDLELGPSPCSLVLLISSVSILSGFLILYSLNTLILLDKRSSTCETPRYGMPEGMLYVIEDREIEIVVYAVVY